MSQVIADELQRYVRAAAEPVKPGETVSAQMRRAQQRLQLKWWRLKACWYGEAGCFSAAAANEVQTQFGNWRAREQARAAEAAQTERLIRQQRDAAALAAARTEHLKALAQIELRLAAMGIGRGDP